MLDLRWRTGPSEKYRSTLGATLTAEYKSSSHRPCVPVFISESQTLELLHCSEHTCPLVGSGYMIYSAPVPGEIPMLAGLFQGRVVGVFLCSFHGF